VGVLVKKRSPFLHKAHSGKGEKGEGGFGHFIGWGGVRCLNVGRRMRASGLIIREKRGREASFERGTSGQKEGNVEIEGGRVRNTPLSNFWKCLSDCMGFSLPRKGGEGEKEKRNVSCC